MGHRDVHRDAAGREAASQGRHLTDVIRLATCAWDAWGDAPPDEAEDVHHQGHLEPWDEDVGKLAVRAQDDRAWDACPWGGLARWLQQ